MQLSLLPLLSTALSPSLLDARGSYQTGVVLLFLPLLSTSILYAVVKEHALDRSCAGKSCLVPFPRIDTDAGAAGAQHCELT